MRRLVYQTVGLVDQLVEFEQLLAEFGRQWRECVCGNRSVELSCSKLWKSLVLRTADHDDVVFEFRQQCFQRTSLCGLSLRCLDQHLRLFAAETQPALFQQTQLVNREVAPTRPLALDLGVSVEANRERVIDGIDAWLDVVQLDSESAAAQANAAMALALCEQCRSLFRWEGPHRLAPL